MSLTSDIAAYLTSQGIIDGTIWKTYAGDPQKVLDAHDRVVVLTILPGEAGDTHDDLTRKPGFKVRVRGRPHKFEDAFTKWQTMYDALHDQHAAVNADPGVSGTYYLIQSDQSAPRVFPDGKDRPNLTCDFRVVMAT
jgi:hypothetical protein